MRRDYALRKPDLVSLLRFSVARSIINFVMEHGFRKNHNFFFLVITPYCGGVIQSFRPCHTYLSTGPDKVQEEYFKKLSL